MKSIILLSLILFSTHVFAQKVTLSGRVLDAASGELLAGVSVWDSLSGAGTFTNAYGFFSLSLPSQTSRVRISHVGYRSGFYKLKPENNSIEILLNRSEELDEIIVKAPKQIAGNPLTLDISEIRSMPALLGEADVLKAFSFTPGVSAGNEGSAGLYVRGGTPDQNLILLDEVPVYNVMHLGGFFSVFNPASLKRADLYKGAFPARYGGRLSSVIDLTMKEGNNKKFGGEVGLGLLNQSLTLEGPIVKNKASFIVSGRISTLGLTTFLNSKRREGTSGEDYQYKFHDLNAKLNYQISKTDHIYLSFYNGFDRFRYDEWAKTSSNEISTRVGNNWGNSTATLRYSKTLSPKLFSRLVLIYSDYTSQFTNEFEDGDDRVFRYSDTRITDIGGKIQFDYFPSKYLDVKAGTEVIRHGFKPFDLTTNYDSPVLQSKENNNTAGVQTDVFIDAHLKPLPKLVIDAGARYTNYNIRGTSFGNIEPRFGLNYRLPKNWKLNASYTVMNQYLHLLANNGYGFGYDAWLPATKTIPPSRAKQWSAGVAKDFPYAGIELSFEYYQKRMSNMTDYPDGTNFTGLLADSWENIVKSGGVGRTSGLEFMAAKNHGKFRGRLSYTLSKSELKFDEINGGNWYPMRYDRRHNLNFSVSYDLSKKWNLNSTFIYQTGHAVTLPVGAVLYNNGPRYIYGDRNNGRMPDFHKLDFGASRNGMILNKYKTKLSFGVYNAYNRGNPLYIDFKVESNNTTKARTLIVKQYSMFPILPFVNYTVTF